jgi:cyclopropane fatty-acyl-phospholipid synthase-like methyltransferase
MNEFQEAKRLADLYSQDLFNAYQKLDHLKRKRVDQIIHFLRNKKHTTILSIGCGPAVIELEIAKRLNKNIIGFDCSPTAIALARKEIEKAIASSAIRENQLKVFEADLMAMPPDLVAILPFSTVICFDVIGAFTLESKKFFLQELWRKCVAPKGTLTLTVLSCIDGSVAEKYAKGLIIKGKTYRARLYSEGAETYAGLLNTLIPQPVWFSIVRLDEESLLIDIKKDS